MVEFMQSHVVCQGCGHSRRASETRCTNCGLDSEPHKAADRGPRGPLQAERRDLVVMFCDLVGSTELASRLDPEEVLELVTAFQAKVAESVKRFGGYVAQYFGDGVMVYFGWPTADETSAESAVRAGLQTVEAVRELSANGQKAQVRIGIASGLVVVGDVENSSNVAQHAVFGEAPNIAARLQGLADPGTVAIDSHTRERIGDLFECSSLGEITIKGYSEPVRVWRAQHESVVQNRFQALRSGKPSSIVGRDREIERLASFWQGARDGKGRAVLVCGEAGIGKSCLVAALDGMLRDEDFTKFSFFCVPYLRDTVLHPVVAHLEHAAGFNRRDTPLRMLQKLKELLGWVEHSDQDAMLLAGLLSLPTEAYGNFDLSPQVRKEKTFQLLTGWLAQSARKQPLVILFEDIHWADPTTLELLEALIDLTRNAPILLIATIRNEFEQLWVGRRSISRIALHRLDPDESRAIASQLIGDSKLPQQLVERIVAESDGIPLFVEELTKAVLESAASSEGSHLSLVPESVPSSLQASLTARIDRLSGAKMIAQIGAVIGREFPYGVLAGVAQLPAQELNRGLAQLVDADLVRCRGKPPHAVYTFKHALVRDAAYEGLLLKQRRALHARVVEVLRERVPDTPDRQPGLLGHHCAQAGLISEAANYFRHAGELSAKRAAVAETRSQLERGLALAGTLPDSSDRRMLEAELKLALGRVLLSMNGSADSEAGRIIEEAVVLCRDQTNVGLVTRVLWAFWFNRAHRRELTTANKVARELLDLANRMDSQPAQIVAQTMRGIVRFWEGRFPAAQASLKRATEMCRSHDQMSFDLAIVSKHIDLHARMQFALSLRCLGHFEAADAQAELAAEKVRMVAHVPSRALVIAAKCRCDWFARDSARTLETATELVELAERQGLPFYLALGQCHLGWLATMEGRSDEGFRLLRDGFETIESSDAYIWQPYIRGMFAEAEASVGNLGQAQALLDEALVASDRTGGAWFEAELHRLKGEVAFKSKPSDRRRARFHFERALTISRGQSAKLWELRTATSLASMLGACGEYRAARDVLAPVHGWFTEGWDSYDVRAAGGVLTSLRSQI